MNENKKNVGSINYALTQKKFGSSLNSAFNRSSHSSSFRKMPKLTSNRTEIGNVSFQSIRKKQSRLSKKPLYEEWENQLIRQEVVWDEFVSFPRQPPRSKQSIPLTAIASLRTCTERKISNSSTKAGCNYIWNDDYVKSWRARKVKGLCEEKASSKIHCYDSLTKSRFCVFENVMLNFKKVRKRKQEGQMIRSFEKGFLATDCGETAPEDINYYQLYSPDIEHKDDFPCDYTLNETVLLYSHDHIRQIGTMIKHYLNIWLMLSLAGQSRYSKDLSLLNMDDFLPSHHHSHQQQQRQRKRGSQGISTGFDSMNHFFKNYNVSFRRLLKASDFMSATRSQTAASASALPPPRVCIKRLLLPPKPLLGYSWEVKETHDPVNHYDCPMIDRSSLLQRWNLQLRNHYQLLSSHLNEELPTNREMKILVLIRSNHTRIISSASSSSSAIHYQSRIILNVEEIIQRLERMVAAQITTVEMTVQKVTDLVTYSYEEQVRLFHSASIIIGMNGGEIATGNIHLPIGTKYCCGVIEIFPESSSISGSSSSNSAGKVMGQKTGYGQLARRLGHVYQRIDLSDSVVSHNNVTKGSIIPINRLEEMVTMVYQEIMQKQGSCFLPEVVKSPYL